MSEKELISAEYVEKMELALKTLDSIESVVIDNADHYQQAGCIQQDIAKAHKVVEALRKETVKPLNEQKALIQEKFNAVLNKLSLGKSKIGTAMIEFSQAEERKIALEQKKREAEAEEIRRKAEEQAQKELAKAKAYRDEGREEMAEKAEARAEDKIEVLTTTVAPEIKATKLKGVSYREDIEIEILDKAQAIKDLMLTPVTSHLVTLDEKGIKALIKSSKGQIKFDWCKVKHTKTQIVRT